MICSRSASKAPVFQYRERDGTVLSEMDMGLLSGETKYPYRIQSEQDNLTRIIHKVLVTMPNVTLRFSSPVVRVEQGHRSHPDLPARHRP